jgi:hypothetical protein
VDLGFPTVEGWVELLTFKTCGFSPFTPTKMVDSDLKNVGFNLVLSRQHGGCKRVLTIGNQDTWHLFTFLANKHGVFYTGTMLTNKSCMFSTCYATRKNWAV